MVVILGILAAIVIPQFSQASTETRESSLASNLHIVRSQIELYKIEHLAEALPGDLGTAADFIADLEGTTGPTGLNANADYGPYMRQVPRNPFSTADDTTNLVRIDGAAAGAGTDHWRFDSTTGDFQADHM